MGRFNDRGGDRFGGHGGGGGGGFSRDRSFSGGDRGGFGGEKKMFKATCEDCGKGCEVPFRPDGRKPVYCTDCFRKGTRQEDSRGPSRGPSRPPMGGSRPEYRSAPAMARPMNDPSVEMLKKINEKLDLILEAIYVDEEDEDGLDEDVAELIEEKPVKAEVVADKKADKKAEKKADKKDDKKADKADKKSDKKADKKADKPAKKATSKKK